MIFAMVIVMAVSNSTKVDSPYIQNMLINGTLSLRLTLHQKD